MADLHDAAEHLRVIRHLMERATVYRAISAPTALTASLLTFSLAFFLNGKAPSTLSAAGYYACWVGVLAAVAAVNTWLLWRDAIRRGVPIISASAIHAWKAIVPPLFTGGVVSFFMLRDSLIVTTLCWIVFYGLSLLATQSFAPASIKALGSVFLLAGLGLWTALHLGVLIVPAGSELALSNWTMAGTFGLFHLCYALATGLKTGFGMRRADRNPSMA